MYELFEKHVLGQWQTVLDAPVPNITAAVVIGLLIWAVHKWAYAQRLEKKDEAIALLDREVMDYRRKLDGASPDEAREQITRLQAEVNELRQAFLPRHLPVDQRKALTEQLLKFPVSGTFKMAVVHDAACADCNRFASEIRSALQAVTSWDVRSGMVIGVSRQPETGLAILVYGNEPPIEAKAISAAFKACGLKHDMIVERRPNNYTVEVLVASRISHSN